MWLKRSSVIFYGLSAFAVALSIISFLKALSCINQPFPGFLVYKVPHVGSMSSPDWPGIKAGLKLMDKIVTADGQPIRKSKDLMAIISQKPPGTLVHYAVETEGQTNKMAIPSSIFSPYDFFMVFFMPFLGGFALFILGFIVYVIKPDVHTSWVFFFFCLIMGIYMVTGFEIQSTYFLVPIHYFAVPLGGALFLHIGLIFPEKKRALVIHPFLEYLIYLPAFILALAFEISVFASQMVPASTNPFFMSLHIKDITSYIRIFNLFCVAGVIILVLHSMAKASSAIVRQRGKMIILGATIGWLLPAMLMLSAHFMKVDFPWNFLPLLGIFFPISIGYSIVRHNLFDAETIIKRAVGYVIVTSVVSGAYIFLSISINFFLGKYEISQSRVFPIVFTLIIILIFNPLRNRIQSLVDRIFFRKEYDYGKIIDKISNAITSLLDLGQILRQLINTFMKDMFINTSSVMLLNPATNEYQVYMADGEKKREVENLTFKRNQPVVIIIENEKKELTKYDVLEDPKYREVSPSCAKDFEILNASLMVPLIFQDKVIGLLNLGEKKSGKFYNREDIDLLHTLANQGAVAIENARLVDKMKAEETVRANLARYLSPQIVDQVIQKNVQVNLGGDRKVVTVLFSDIRNFTRISETLPSDQLVSLLNEYFTEMAKIIFEHQGSLDKYIGDAIVAVFGSLIPLENSAGTAVQTAIQMMKRMASLKEKWKNQLGVEMDMGIGINTGEVFLGNIGSPERMEFTVIGDTVNIASRFSGAAREGQILVTKDTLLHLSQNIKYAELEPIEVKGKTGRLDVFEIIYLKS